MDFQDINGDTSGEADHYKNCASGSYGSYDESFNLQQSLRCWNEKFNSVMVKLEFQRSKHAFCLYVRRGRTAEETAYLVLCLMPCLLLEDLKKQLIQKFNLTDCGAVNSFLGLKIQYDYVR